MSTAILRPHGVLDATEAMGLRDAFTHILENGDSGVIVDLTGVQVLSAAGLAAVTNLLGQGRRNGIEVRVLPPEEGSEASDIIEKADLRRFISPGGLWNTQWNEPPTPAPPCRGRRHPQPSRPTPLQRLQRLFLRNRPTPSVR